MNLNGITLGNRMQAAPQVRANNRNSVGFGSGKNIVRSDEILRNSNAIKTRITLQLPKNNFTPESTLKMIKDFKIPFKNIQELCNCRIGMKRMKENAAAHGMMSSKNIPVELQNLS